MHVFSRWLVCSCGHALLCCTFADNNEFFVVDYKLVRTGQPPLPGAVWILDQIPGTVQAADITDLLVSRTYWPSYNVPYFPGVYNLSGWPQLVDQYGSWFTYEGAPRAEIFRRAQANVRRVCCVL
jgi:hypothetical protein